MFLYKILKRLLVCIAHRQKCLTYLYFFTVNGYKGNDVRIMNANKLISAS
jgi:hypothetical protein